jgi:hypothetical protein
VMFSSTSTPMAQQTIVAAASAATAMPYAASRFYAAPEDARQYAGGVNQPNKKEHSGMIGVFEQPSNRLEVSWAFCCSGLLLPGRGAVAGVSASCANASFLRG